MSKENKLTGYPSIDKPWLKYYSEEAINAPLPECTMYQYIWESNKEHLSDIALRYYGTKTTYGKLFENIKKAANAFYAMGVHAGDIVTIMSMHTPETIYAIYGLNYIGAIANMVYMTLAEKEILHTVESTGSKFLLVLDAALEKVEAIKAELRVPVVMLGVADSMPPHIKLGYRLKVKPKKHMFMAWLDFLKQDAAESPMAADHFSPAVIVYSSGSTGEPKGVVLSNDALNAHSFQLIHANFGFIRCKRFLNILPPFIGFGISHIHLALNNGLDCTLWIDLNPKSVSDQFFRMKPEYYVTGPAFVDAFLDHKPEDLSNLILFVGGGGALPEKTEYKLNDFLQRCGANTIYANGYGTTETSSTLCATANGYYRPESVGLPMPRTNIRVMSDDGLELTYRQTGELCFCTPSLMSGYYRNEKATQESIFEDDSGNRWLHTGDLGYIDEDGFVYIKGRIKRIYITRGKDGTAYKLFPQKIEELISKLDEIEACGVVAFEDQERMYVPVIFATPKNSSIDMHLLETQLWLYVKNELSEYEQPVAINVLSSLPMTPSGKIDYQTLEKMRKLETLQSST